MTGGAISGGVATRAVPQMLLGANNAGLMGYLANAAVAGIGGWLTGKFFSQKFGQGWLIGGAVALTSRILSDQLNLQVWNLGAGAATAPGVSGDLDFDLGFYLQNSFPVPTTGQGPFLLNAGQTGGPMQAGGVPTVMALPASAGSGSAAGVASGSADGSGNGAHASIDRWGSRWAA